MADARHRQGITTPVRHVGLVARADGSAFMIFKDIPAQGRRRQHHTRLSREMPVCPSKRLVNKSKRPCHRAIGHAREQFDGRIGDRCSRQLPSRCRGRGARFAGASTQIAWALRLQQHKAAKMRVAFIGYQRAQFSGEPNLFVVQFIADRRRTSRVSNRCVHAVPCM